MSKFEKLIKRIHNLSNDLRFSEIKKILEFYGYVMHLQEVEAAIILLGRKTLILLRFLNMNQLKKFILL